MPTETAPPPAATEPKTATIDAPEAGEKAPADFMADIIGDLADMDAGREPTPRERDDKGKFKPREPEPEKAPEKPTAKTPEKPPEKEPEKAPEKPPEVKPVKAAELRNAYEGLKKRVREELEPEVQRLRAKVQDYESKPKEDSSPLLEKVKTLEQRNAELEKHIQYVDYMQSGEFREKYAQPYQQAWDDAITEFKELTVREQAGEDEMGEPRIQTRPANESDLIKLGAMRLSEMDEAAQKMFGPSAARAINHVQRLRQLATAKAKALNDAQQKAGEWKSQQQAEMHSRSQTLAKLWQDVTKNLEEKLPRAYKPDDGDDVDKEAFNRGFALADLLFLGTEALTPEQADLLPNEWRDVAKSKQPMNDSQRVRLHAIARLKMANHDRQLAKLKRANDRIKELEKELSQYQKSEPESGASRPSEHDAPKDWLQEVEDDLRKMDRA